jgi:DNA polymerase III alpha subunit
MGIEVLPPDIMKSQHDIAVIEGNIYFGLAQVTGIKAKTTTKYVMDVRKDYDVLTPDLLHDRLEADNLAWEAEKKAALAEGKAFRKRSPKQVFPANRIDALEQAGAFDNYLERDIKLSVRQKLEKELLGVILTDDSRLAFASNEDEMTSWIHGWHDETVDGFEELKYPEVGTSVRVPGVISQIEPKKTRKDGKSMGIVTIEYEGNEAEFAVFPQQWKKQRHLWRERQAGLFELKVTERGCHFEYGMKLD